MIYSLLQSSLFSITNIQTRMRAHSNQCHSPPCRSYCYKLHIKITCATAVFLGILTFCYFAMYNEHFLVYMADRAEQNAAVSLMAVQEFKRASRNIYMLGTFGFLLCICTTCLVLIEIHQSNVQWTACCMLSRETCYKDAPHEEGCCPEVKYIRAPEETFTPLSEAHEKKENVSAAPIDQTIKEEETTDA